MRVRCYYGKWHVALPIDFWNGVNLNITSLRDLHTRGPRPEEYKSL